MVASVLSLFRLSLGSARDLAPIVLVIAFFQLVILRQPLPDLASIAVGLVLVTLGLTLFVQGLEMGLFPLGESMAHGFARKGSAIWLLAFAFCLGFAATVAEPALVAVAGEAARAAAEGGLIAPAPETVESFAFGLRMTVAVAVGVALLIGIMRIVRGWPIHWLIIGGYVLVIAVTPLAPEEIVGVAYDSGGVTTGTITVPLITALGVGLAQMIKGRNPMIEGFGLIALASLTPILFVMAYGIFWTRFV